MILNYLKLGVRSLFDQKSYTIINILGLSIGMAAFILIFLHIQYETGYNEHTKNSHRIYRCVEIQQAPGVGEQHVAVTMGPLGPALLNDFPEVEAVNRIMYWGARPLEYNGKVYDQR